MIVESEMLDSHEEEGLERFDLALIRHSQSKSKLPWHGSLIPDLLPSWASQRKQFQEGLQWFQHHYLQDGNLVQR